MIRAVIYTLLLGCELIANPIVCLAEESLDQPSIYEADSYDQSPVAIDFRAPLRAAPVAVPRRFACHIPHCGLRKLGPCLGACEINWYSGRLWVRPELLAWDTKGTSIPALVTTGTTATPPANAGALDQADTSVLFGGTPVHNEFRMGARLNAGFWFTAAQRTGIEATYLGVDGLDYHFRGESDDFPILARPYTDATTGNAAAQLVAYPGLLEGSTLVRVDFELAGAEVLLRHALAWSPRARVDLLAGYRHGYLFDRVFVDDQSTSLDAASGFATDAVVVRRDRFQTKNDFHGGELGLAGRMWKGCWSLSWHAKGAYGGAFARSGIYGDTTVTEDVAGTAVTTTYDGGLLALPTNAGDRSQSDTAWMGEIGLNLECQIRHDMRIAFGYTFLYWDNVARAETLVPTSINPTQIPPGTLTGVSVPAFMISSTSFWAQGINASFEYQF